MQCLKIVWKEKQNVRSSHGECAIQCHLQSFVIFSAIILTLQKLSLISFCWKWKITRKLYRKTVEDSFKFLEETFSFCRFNPSRNLCIYTKLLPHFTAVRHHFIPLIGDILPFYFPCSQIKRGREFITIHFSSCYEHWTMGCFAFSSPNSMQFSGKNSSRLWGRQKKMDK